jgi:hypothetical protein
MTQVDQAIPVDHRDPEDVSSMLFSEIIYFEIGDRLAAQQLCTRLGSTRLAWVEAGEVSLLVGVVLSSDAEDLAVLLRDVETWLGETAIGPIPVEIDGCAYLLQPRGADSHAAA